MQFILFYVMFLQLLFDLRSKDSEVEKYKSRLEVQYDKQYYFYYMNINHYIKNKYCLHVILKIKMSECCNVPLNCSWKETNELNIQVMKENVVKSRKLFTLNYQDNHQEDTSLGPLEHTDVSMCREARLGDYKQQTYL